MALRAQSVRLSTGVELQFVEQGDAGGVPVILLHGITDSWRSFELVLPHLPGSIRAFAVTQRGHGDSDRGATGYRTRDFAADVAAFADAHGLAKVVVVGHSMGSTNAQRFAIDHPDRVLGLVAAASFASYGEKASLVEFCAEAIFPLEDPVDPGLAREFQESTLAQPIPPSFLETVVQESLKLPARVWREAFAGVLEDDFVAELGRIAAPTLLIWGRRDTYAVRADQDALLAAIPGSRLLVYENAGHALHWEEPARFAADLAAFVASLG